MNAILHAKSKEIIENQLKVINNLNLANDFITPEAKAILATN